MSIYEKRPTLQLSDSDVRALAHSLETLPDPEQLRATEAQGSPRSLIIDGHTLDVSDEIVQSVVDMLTRLAEGKGVVVGSVDELMTTGQTAEFLGISRTYVIQLIDKGLLVAEYRGTHRRITMGSAIAHAKRTQQLQQRNTSARD
jgi:excisionase family DNA binding protein